MRVQVKLTYRGGWRMASNSNQVLMRNEIPEELTWRLEDIFATDAQWEEELKEVAAFAKEAPSYAGTLKKMVQTPY